MAEETDKIVLLTYELLQGVHTRLDKIESDILEVKSRLSSLEITVAQQGVQVAEIHRRMDRFDERPTRIERRLDIVDSPDNAA